MVSVPTMLNGLGRFPSGNGEQVNIFMIMFLWDRFFLLLPLKLQIGWKALEINVIGKAKNHDLKLDSKLNCL